MPIEKRKNGSKKIDNSAESNETNNEHKSSRVRAEKTENNETNSSNWTSSRLVWWVVLIWIVLIIFIIFTFSKFNSFSSWEDVQSLEKKIEKLEWKISDLEKKWSREVYQVNYWWWSDLFNNLKWIWEKSLWFPDYLKWKSCFILWSKISWDDGWTIRWYLWKNGNWSSYETSANYEASINNAEEKIEITKRNGSTSMLTKKERDNLYFSLTLLCR